MKKAAPAKAAMVKRHRLGSALLLFSCHRRSCGLFAIDQPPILPNIAISKQEVARAVHTKDGMTTSLLMKKKFGDEREAPFSDPYTASSRSGSASSSNLPYSDTGTCAHQMLRPKFVHLDIAWNMIQQ